MNTLASKASLVTSVSLSKQIVLQSFIVRDDKLIGYFSQLTTVDEDIVSNISQPDMITLTTDAPKEVQDAITIISNYLASLENT